MTSAINILGDARNAARPVGRLLPNDLGLFDVHGNLCEWSQEDYRAYPIAERIVDDGSLAAVSENVPRALRGGDFVHGPHDSRAASRANYSPASRPANDSYNVAGFRPVRTYALPAISPSTPAQKLKGHDIKP